MYTANQKILLSAVFLVVLAAAGFSVYKSKNSTQNAQISNFEDCANAGYPVMESYPRQCRVPGGELFVENIDPNNPNPNPNPSPKPNPVGKGDCYVGGCSNESCSDRKDAITACIYKDEFACYKNATCERQANGQCGWTKTPAFYQCMGVDPQ